MVIITNKKLKPREKDDFYPTPYNLARVICDQFVDEEPEFALDPGMGNGTFGVALRDSCRQRFGFVDTEEHPEFCLDGVDIVNRLPEKADWTYSNEYFVDFLKFDERIKYDLIIGNPPYKLAEEFIRHSFELSSEKAKIIFLIKLNFLASKKRATGLFKEFPPTEVHVLANRPSFYGTGKTNDYEFAVFVWDKMEVGRYPVIRWLDWKSMI